MNATNYKYDMQLQIKSWYVMVILIHWANFL